jgi:hypothetical protein
LPLGSGDVLPASEWGFRGSARTEAELNELLQSSRHTPCAVAPSTAEGVFHGPQNAVKRIVDMALSTGIESDVSRADFNPLPEEQERNEFRSTTEAAA